MLRGYGYRLFRLANNDAVFIFTAAFYDDAVDGDGDHTQAMLNEELELDETACLLANPLVGATD